MKNSQLQARSCCWRAVPKSKNYNNVVKTPRRTGWRATGRPKGQRALVSPEAIGSLIVTKEGDPLIAVSGSG